eukprot:SAG31_NODE_171_length_21415_cov_7.512807_8_plen_59_part_00
MLMLCLELNQIGLSDCYVQLRVHSCCGGASYLTGIYFKIEKRGGGAERANEPRIRYEY